MVCQLLDWLYLLPFKQSYEILTLSKYSCEGIPTSPEQFWWRFAPRSFTVDNQMALNVCFATDKGAGAILCAPDRKYAVSVA